MGSGLKKRMGVGEGGTNLIPQGNEYILLQIVILHQAYGSTRKKFTFVLNVCCSLCYVPKMSSQLPVHMWDCFLHIHSSWVEIKNQFKFMTST